MADLRHLEILNHGVEAWNAWRLEHPEVGPDLSEVALVDDYRGFDLHGADLRRSVALNMDFRGADLRGAKLDGARLHWSCFADVDLTGASLKGATLHGTDLSGAVLRGVDLSGAAPTAADLRGADLAGATLEDCAFTREQLLEAGYPLKAVFGEGDPEQIAILRQGVDAWNAWRAEHEGQAFRRLDLRCADLAGFDFSTGEGPANLIGVDLRGADLRGAKLGYAQLALAWLGGVDLQGAELDTVDLNGASLRGANLAGLVVSLQSRLDSADLYGADLRGTDFAGASMEGTELAGAYSFIGATEQLAVLLQGAETWNAWRAANPDVSIDLRGANLVEEHISDADLHEADLRGAVLVDAYLQGADLTRANLERANLSGASLIGAKLVEADLQLARLVKASLYNCDLSGAFVPMADLTEASLGGANLSDAQLGGARLEKAWLNQARLTRADLSDADLSEALGHDADLSGATLTGAKLSRSSFGDAKLQGADLSEANLTQAGLRGTDLSGANLQRAQLNHADLSGTILTDADLTDATLTQASMVETVLGGATISGCQVYGVAAWGLDLSEVRDQSNLMITPEGEAAITVDSLEVAQFIYLMLHNQKIRDVIDTVTGKGVLILGRFTDERKAVLDGIKERLRTRNLVPMVFDWPKSEARDLTETVQLLASMSRFVVADLTDARSLPQELSKIVPHMPSLPVRPIILASQREYAMFEHFEPYPWVLPVYPYENREQLLGDLDEAILTPVEQWKSRATEGDLEKSELRAKIEQLQAQLAAERASKS